MGVGCRQRIELVGFNVTYVFLTKIFGDPNQRVVAKFQPLVNIINGLKMPCSNLMTGVKIKTQEFKSA